MGVAHRGLRQLLRCTEKTCFTCHDSSLRRHLGITLALCLTGAVVGLAQTPAQGDLVPPPIWAFNDLACAPYVTTEAPTLALRVVGSQDTVVKHMMGPGDILVISGGSAAGLAAGQEYYVRRLIRSFGTLGPDEQHPASVHTAAWVRILGVDVGVATATVTHACEGILLDDYLEPFSPPLIAAQTLPTGTVQFDNMGRILTGDEARSIAGIKDLMNIDRGSNTGIVIGQRFLVFRDKRTSGADTSGYSRMLQQDLTRVPLVEIGEVVVVAVRPNSATVQVMTARDAIQSGDLIAAVQ